MDRGYDVQHIRRYLHRHGILGMIPERRPAKEWKRRRRGHPPVFDTKLYAKRNVIERMIRRVKIRSEKQALHFLTMVKPAFIRRYLKTGLSNAA